MTEKLDKARQAQILTAEVKRIMDALHDGGGEARVVGGAVRDAMLARPVGDIDLAVNLPPERVMEILARNQIKTVPTGLAHGTITAVVNRSGYEITSLRRDLETDGRHARVAYTDDWQADAARRDFTFNALYLDAEGNLYDYFGGAADGAAGRVCFIGDARARIREDVLRILRFFRFYAWFGHGNADAEALGACRELADLIPRLSAERVARETMKLLAAENPLPAWRLMLDGGIARYFLPEATGIARLQSLLANEKKFNEPPSFLIRLAALLPQDAAIVAAARLKLANRDSVKLCALAALPSLLRDQMAPPALRRMLYEYGADNCRAALFIEGENIDKMLAVIDAWEDPIFPVKGEDIVRLGVPAGQRVGEILHTLEQWWIAGDFRAARDMCLAQIREEI